jgi:hypothetical protein
VTTRKKGGQVIKPSRKKREKKERKKERKKRKKQGALTANSHLLSHPLLSFLSLAPHKSLLPLSPSPHCPPTTPAG